MKLIANSVFLLPDGNKSVPGTEIPYDDKKAPEWINKGLAYLVEGESSFVISEDEISGNGEEDKGTENGEGGSSEGNSETGTENKLDEKKKVTPPRAPRNKVPNKKQVKK